MVYHEQSNQVVQANSQAINEGVECGQGLAQAAALCPHVRILAFNREAEKETLLFLAHRLYPLASDIVIDGQTVLAEGYEIEPPAGKMQLWYSADGVLVKYAWRWMGVRAEALLQDPPRQTLDTTPAIDDGPVVTETAL